jgi:hypothetical protein
MAEMYICPKWRECKVCRISSRPHKKRASCDYSNEGCPKCVPVESKDEDALLGATNG